MTAAERPLRLVGERHPYISTRELADWLSRGGQRWRTERVRDVLERAGALVVLPNAKSPSRHQRTARRAKYTTAALLAARLPEMHAALLACGTGDEDEGARALGGTRNDASK